MGCRRQGSDVEGGRLRARLAEGRTPELHESHSSMSSSCVPRPHSVQLSAASSWLTSDSSSSAVIASSRPRVSVDCSDRHSARTRPCARRRRVRVEAVRVHRGHVFEKSVTHRTMQSWQKRWSQQSRAPSPSESSAALSVVPAHTGQSSLSSCLLKGNCSRPGDTHGCAEEGERCAPPERKAAAKGDEDM